MKYQVIKSFFAFAFLFLICSAVNAQNFKKAKLLFEDNGTSNWNNKWQLDGKRSRVINNSKGMELIAGTEHGNDSCHTVLWTKQSFKGNICIEYDYTRTDTASRCVNILYFHATGKGDADFPTDIMKWNHKREVPSMKTYFNNMNTYHISYAALSAKKYSGSSDYVRLRRYLPTGNGIKGTDIPNDYFTTGLFKSGITYHISVYKYDNEILMKVQNSLLPRDNVTFKWDTSLLPACEEGRIGLRHMYTRSARYKNLKVWALTQK